MFFCNIRIFFEKLPNRSLCTVPPVIIHLLQQLIIVDGSLSYVVKGQDPASDPYPNLNPS